MTPREPVGITFRAVSNHPMPYSSAQFFQLLPAALRDRLPPDLRKFRTAGRAWLAQFYYAEPQLHYEVWTLGQSRGRLEIGLHFESRDPSVNAYYLDGFDRHLVEIKSRLGPSWEAEAWDKGWTKVYELWPLERFSDRFLERIARRVAESIAVLQPMFDDLHAGWNGGRVRRRTKRDT